MNLNNPQSPCPHCAGKGTVTVKATGKDGVETNQTLTCPVCKGSKKSNGLMTK